MPIKKTDVFDYLLLILIYLQLVILGFFGFGDILNKIISVLILFRVILLPGKNWQRGLLYGASICIMYILSLLLGDNFIFSNAKSNFLMMVYPLIYAYYITFICKNKPGFMDRVIEKGFWLFNITMVANIIVLLIQIFVPNSISAVVADTHVMDLYEDTVSGLFEYASTHVVNLFTVFILLYDLAYVKTLRHKSLRILIWILVAVLTAISSFIATYNDNKAFFLFFPLAIVMFWLSGKIDFSRRILKIMVFSLLIPLVLFALYNSIDGVRQFIDYNFVRTINLVNNSRRLGNSANGSNERIAILAFALSKSSTWLTGTGFGSAGLYESNYMSFFHFGQADLGTLLILGGIWFTILLTVFYMKSFLIIIEEKRENRTVALRLAVFVILFSTMIYTQCFTRTKLITSLILIMLSFRVRTQYLRNAIRREQE